MNMNIREFDYNCYKFNQDLINLINESELPPTAIANILRDIMNSVTTAMETSIKTVEEQIKQQQQKEEENKKSGNQPQQEEVEIEVVE